MKALAPSDLEYLVRQVLNGPDQDEIIDGFSEYFRGVQYFFRERLNDFYQEGAVLAEDVPQGGATYSLREAKGKPELLLDYFGQRPKEVRLGFAEHFLKRSSSGWHACCCSRIPGVGRKSIHILKPCAREITAWKQLIWLFFVALLRPQSVWPSSYEQNLIAPIQGLPMRAGGLESLAEERRKYLKKRYPKTWECCQELAGFNSGREFSELVRCLELVSRFDNPSGLTADPDSLPALFRRIVRSMPIAEHRKEQLDRLLFNEELIAGWYRVPYAYLPTATTSWLIEIKLNVRFSGQSVDYLSRRNTNLPRLRSAGRPENYRFRDPVDRVEKKLPDINTLIEQVLGPVYCSFCRGLHRFPRYFL